MPVSALGSGGVWKDRAPVLWACVLLEITDNRQINSLDEKGGGDVKRLLLAGEAVETKAIKERRYRQSFPTYPECQFRQNQMLGLNYGVQEELEEAGLVCVCWDSPL